MAGKEQLCRYKYWVGGGSKRGWSQSSQSWVPWLCSWFTPYEEINLKSFESGHFDSHQHSWAVTQWALILQGEERGRPSCVCSSCQVWHLFTVTLFPVTLKGWALTFSWWGNFLHCTHRSWKSNIPLWQQRGEVMNNLRISALALPSLRKQSACCLGRWLENMFIAVMPATGGGRGEWGRGGRGGGSHSSLPAVSFSLEGHPAIPPGVQVPVAEGALALSELPWRVVELWEFSCLVKIQNTLSRTG